MESAKHYFNQLHIKMTTSPLLLQIHIFLIKCICINCNQDNNVTNMAKYSV